MIIIYYCFAGAHASVVASAIHCGMLPENRVPSKNEFLAVPYYDATKPDMIGQLYFMGCDTSGNQVYFMGMRNQRRQVLSILQQILELGGRLPDSYIFQDAFPLINFSTKCGGLLSKRWHLSTIGRSLTIWGIQRQYPQFVKLVNDVRQQIDTVTS